MADEVAMLLIDEVLTEVTDTNGGQLLVLNASVRNIGPVRIGLPTSEAQKLFTVLLAGASRAYGKQAAAAGGEENLLNLQGLAAFRPTDFELGQASSPQEHLVLLRLKQNRMPMIDVVLDFPSAGQLASALLEHADKGPGEPAAHQ
jgi:hypothetical protein